MHHFPDTSLLITHYNRSASLENLLKSFEKLQCTFAAIVVSDDASKEPHHTNIKELQSKYNFELISAEKNGGLGRNINKGQDAISTPYTLYVQEDFEPTDKFLPSFTNAHTFMEEDKDLDYIRFYAYVRYPYLKKFKAGFSKIDIPLFAPNHQKIYAYSDHPHLRRSGFFDKFGRYAEGVKVDKTEYRMCISFLQNKGKALFYDNFSEVFLQKNSAQEPSTVARSDWKESSNFFITLTRNIYRQIKYNFDILFMGPLKNNSKQ